MLFGRACCRVSHLQLAVHIRVMGLALGPQLPPLDITSVMMMSAVRAAPFIIMQEGLLTPRH